MDLLHAANWGHMCLHEQHSSHKHVWTGPVALKQHYDSGPRSVHTQ
jgi:hypothetical protein